MSTSPLKTVSRLILASGSPRRRSLLLDLGLDFEVIKARVEEIPEQGESPEEFVQRAASDKAGEVAGKNPDSWVLGADTVVVNDGIILGKPDDADQALETLLSLSGKKHLVHTGFCLKNGKDNIAVRRVVTTEVSFSPFTRAVAEAYVIN